MKLFSNKLRLAFASLLLSALLPVTAMATPTFIGSFQVDDGAWWNTNPDVYSGVEAAALLFGGLPTDYRISTNAQFITDTAWYSIIGIGGGHEYDDDYSVDLMEDGYGGPMWTNYSDISAYVGDNARGATYTNYVFLEGAAAVSEPATIALVGLGMIGLGVVRRRKQQ